MKLALPACAPAVEGNAVKIHPGAITLFQLKPFLVALLGGKLGVLVYNVLAKYSRKELNALGAL